MKRILLHIGLPKTGTTSIQEFLAHEAAALAGEGVLFPIVRTDLRDAGRKQGIGVGWHLALSKIVAERTDTLAPGELAAWQAAFDRFAADPALHTLLLSQEGLLLGRKPQGVAALMAALPPGRVEIVLVLRPALGWLTSLYEQLVRSAVRISAPPADFRQAHAYVERGFAPMIRALRQQLPDARLHLLSFDDLGAGEGLLANFARAIGLSPALVAKAAGAPRSNSGLPQEMVAVLRAVNERGIDHAGFVAIRGALARAARRRTGKAPRASIFPPDLTTAILAQYERDRLLLKRRFDLDLRAETAPPPGDFRLNPADWSRIRAEAAPFLGEAGAAAWDAVAELGVGE